MYNQSVTYSSSTWGYTPVKYWPNEFGKNALSEDVDKVSFFAYAPYVTVDVKSGKVTENETFGIVGMTRNNEAGDPMVKYINNLYTNNQVDLLWGVSGGVTWNKKNGGTTTFTAGLPWLNVEHPNTTTTESKKVWFNFLHSLASLNVQVVTDVDKASGTAAGPATGTKVFIRSVTFEGFDTKGALNLNNIEASKALWYNLNCGTELNNGAVVTIQDGRKDDKEGLTAATKELAVINPTFVQNKDFDASEAGVTEIAGNLFRTSGGGVPDATAPIYVIPNGDKLKVTIEYDVLTKDANLAGYLNDGTTHGSVVKNVITRYITTSGSGSVDALEPGATPDAGIVLENGKKYTITLRLGLNSVQFNASVTPWTTVSGGAYLPHNN
jgi:hypothetical protein